MGKFRTQNTKFKDNEKIIAGTGDDSEITFDGTDKTITTSAGIGINITPGGDSKVVLDGMNFPITDGTNGQALTTDGAGQMSWTTISG